MQAAVLISNYMLGVSILTLPRTSVEAAQTPDVWISLILSGLMTVAVGILIVKLSQRFPGQTFYQYNRLLVGKWLGIALSFFTALYFIVMASFEARAVMEVTRLFLLEGTPNWAITFAFMWVGVYLIIGGINPVARVCEIIFPITTVILILIAFMGLSVFELDNIRPVLGHGFMPVLRGLKTTVLAYTSVEIMLVIPAFMKHPEKAVKAVLIGVLIPTFFYVVTCVTVIGTLSVDGVITRTWPTISLFRSFEFRGIFFERFETLLLVIWLMQIFATFSLSYYLGALGIAQSWKVNQRTVIFVLLAVIFLLSFAPADTNEVFKVGDMLGYSSLVLFILVPAVLYVLPGKKGVGP
ncbi:spore germination protein [Paenibacillus ehimensis]|uniref:spore germination protein n=1 Tax=Paenibacillus ehimensis TaxID=79264 RepID=UPI000FD96199|nr:spore germination protein [Paenibacillus ehimensis]